MSRKKYDQTKDAGDRDRIKDLESALQLERSFAKHIMEASPLLICAILPDGITTYVNKAVREKTGYAREEVIGKNWWNLFYPGDEYRQVTELFAAFERGEVKDYQMTLTAKNGEKRTVAWNSVNRFSVSGELEEVVGVGLDITEMLEMQRQVTITAKMTALGEMAGGIAHEINTPLATIKLVSSQVEEILKERPGQLDMASFMLAKIGRTVDRIAKIVQGLRFFSRDGGNDPYQSVRLRTLIDDTVVLCLEKFKSLGITLDVGAFDETLAIETKPVELSQVLLNLLNNARDAVERLQEKWVRIAVEESGGYVVLRVTDSGPGIPVEVHKKLFQPFFTTKGVGKGTGLGLPIAAGIVGGHGGTLKLDTDCPNTSFVIRVPRERQRRAA